FARQGGEKEAKESKREMRRCSSLPAVIRAVGGASGRGASTYTKDTQRNQPMGDAYTGEQMTVGQPADELPFVQFNAGTLEQVRVPELSLEQRARSDLERNRAALERFGPRGPGDAPKLTATQDKRRMALEAQDIDGLPWEVRWRRSVLPTAEELVQDLRDRFE